MTIRLCLRFWIFPLILILFLVLNSAVIADESASVCSDMLHLLTTSPFLLGRTFESIVDERGASRIPNLDIDEDGFIDAVYWECPNQGSSMAVDPCSLRIKLFSGNTIEFKEYGFSLILFKSRIYAIAASAGSRRLPSDGKAWKIDSSGVKLVCSDL